MPVSLSLPVIYTIILIEGFVTISLEILSIRQLVPFIGNTVVTTSLIIGVFLLFLARGYQKGGQIKEAYESRLIQNFLYAGLFIGIGLSFPFLEIYFTWLTYPVKDYLLSILMVYLLVILAPSIYLLGQTVPITMHLRTEEGTAGSIGGKVLHLSTLGSFLGAVLTSLVCMRFFGVAQTVMLNYLCLLFLIGLLVFKSKQNGFYLFLGCIAIIPIYIMNVSFENMHFVKTTNFANYQITKTHQFYQTEGTALVINHSYSSYINDDLKGFPYVEKIRSIFKDLEFKNKKILVLGAGGFVLGADDKHNFYTYIDIDDALPKIVTDNGFIEKIQGNVIIKDARQYLLTTDEKYDAIVLDAFTHKRAMPFHLTTLAFFELAKAHLKEDGIFISNIIMDPWLQTDFSINIDNTLRSAFGVCTQNPLQFKKAHTNNIYVCQSRSERSASVYLDNDNRNEFDLFNQD